MPPTGALPPRDSSLRHPASASRDHRVPSCSSSVSTANPKDAHVAYIHVREGKGVDVGAQWLSPTDMPTLH